jgi:uncharacterized protein (DUF1499 family)
MINIMNIGYVDRTWLNRAQDRVIANRSCSAIRQVDLSENRRWTELAQDETQW